MSHFIFEFCFKKRHKCICFVIDCIIRFWSTISINKEFPVAKRSVNYIAVTIVTKTRQYFRITTNQYWWITLIFSRVIASTVYLLAWKCTQIRKRLNETGNNIHIRHAWNYSTTLYAINNISSTLHYGVITTLLPSKNKTVNQKTVKNSILIAHKDIRLTKINEF